MAAKEESEVFTAALNRATEEVISIAEAGEKIIVPVAGVAGQFVQGLLQVPVCIPYGDVLKASLKAKSNDQLLDALADPTVVEALQDPQVIRSLKNPKVLLALKEEKLPTALEFIEQESKKKEVFAEDLILAIIDGYKEALNAATDDAVYNGHTSYFYADDDEQEEYGDDDEQEEY